MPVAVIEMPGGGSIGFVEVDGVMTSKPCSCSTSTLDWRNMAIVSAETGRDAIKILQDQPDVDIVLMDIMMPELDGYETIRRIRSKERFADLPIIALTAKAMRQDRDSCIAAGASEYISKPVDTEQLVSLLRVWLNR